MKRCFTWFALMLGTIGFAGCGPASSDKPATSEAGHEDHEHGDQGGADHGHDHSAPGPHGGMIIDWGGGKFHVELVIDDAKKEVTVYVLDESMKKSVPVDATELQLSLKEPVMELTLAAVATSGETSGTSQFSAPLPMSDKEIHWEGTISGVVDGVPYAGEFHDEHDHDHDHEKK